MIDPATPGLESVSPALTGRVFTTDPAGKPRFNPFCKREADDCGVHHIKRETGV